MKTSSKTNTAIKTASVEAPIVLTVDQIAQIAAGMAASGGSHTTMGRTPVVK